MKKYGIDFLREFIKSVPTTPGVYRMFDENANILYVGKAKNLVNRISQYTQVNNLSERIKQMVLRICSMEIITCETEKEALLLEANLIKSLKPKYNILLKDDKSFPYLVIRTDHDFGQIVKYRGVKNFRGKSYGPFASVKYLNKAVETLQKVFPLRTCTDAYFAARTRPCIQYEIKRCSAPCVNKINRVDYQILLSQAENFLKGNTNDIQKELVKQMEQASENMQYEIAAQLRDRIVALNNIQSQQAVSANVKDCDFIAIAMQNNLCCIQVFFFRGGQNYGNKSYFPSQIEDSNIHEILEFFITNFYQHNEVPPEIIISHNIEEKEQLEDVFKTKILIPKGGEKYRIINFVLQNAITALGSKKIDDDHKKYILHEIAKKLKINNEIMRIDVFDNSHLFGKHAISAMIVYDEYIFNKKKYRLFKCKYANTNDDYDMMSEALTRRYSKLKKEYPIYQAQEWPDLIIVDGGPGHLAITRKILAELALKIPFICIAKGPKRNAGGESIYLENGESFTLPNDNVMMQFFQRLRDEAHRFAITSHRKMRDQDMTKSSLDDIPNIGPKRKKILLNYFGSISAIKDASIKELEKLDSINTETATKIYNYFHQQ